MLKVSKLLALLLCLPSLMPGAEAPPDIAWARKAGSADTDQGRALAVDTNGNIHVTGFFSGTANFGGTNLVSAGTEDIFVAKYNAAGTLLWARRGGGSSYDEGRSIGVDASGNVYVAGHFQGTATFTSTNVSSSGESDVFVAKYNSGGVLLWVRKAGGNNFDEAHSLVLDSGGNVFITGSFDATATFGSSTLTNTSGSSDIFVARCDSSGTFSWARRAGGNGDDSGNGIALDSMTNVYVTGFFSSNASFAPTNLSAAASDIFLAKYNPTGALAWVRQAGGTNQDVGHGVAVDTAGNIFITGQFRIAASFSGTNITGMGADMFLARYNTAGVLSWARRAGGNDAIYGDQGTSVRLDATGNAYVTGHFSGTATFGTTNITTSGFNDVFIAKYATDGQAIWVRRLGGTGLDVGYAIAVDTSNGVAVTGFFYDTITAGATNLTGSGLDDAFVVRFVGAAPPAPPTLSIVKSSGNVVLSWPVASGNFVLESAPTVPTNNWSNVMPAPATNGSLNVVTQSTFVPQRFFRLRAP